MDKDQNLSTVDDPQRPYKAVAAFIVAAGTAALASADVMPVWLVIVLGALVAGVATFATPNPKV